MTDKITIEVDRNLAQHFLKLAEIASDRLANTGCNDYAMDDTPANRELHERVDANNYGMSLEEWRASDDYYPPVANNEFLWAMDYAIFDLFVDAVKEAVE